MNKEQFLNDLSKLFIANAANNDENAKLSNLIIERLILRMITDPNYNPELKYDTLEELNEFKATRDIIIANFFQKLVTSIMVWSKEYKSYEELLVDLASNPSMLIENDQVERMGVIGTGDTIITQNEAKVLYDNLLFPYYKSLGLPVIKNADGTEKIELPILADSFNDDNNPEKVSKLREEYISKGCSDEDFDYVYHNCSIESEALSMPFATSELNFIASKLKSAKLEHTPGQTK